MSTTQHQQQADLSYIFEPVPPTEFFQPKDGRNPSAAKRKDARRVRRQELIWQRQRPAVDSWDEGDFGFSKNGMPYYKQDGRTHFRVSAYPRPRSRFIQRSGNGKVEGYVKPLATKNGKHSREMMKLHHQWWLEATAYLQELHQAA